MKKIKFLFFTVFLLVSSISNVIVNAESTPYESFIQLAGTDYWGWSQNLYEPSNMFNTGLKKPEDIFYFEGKLYVADSGVRAIVIFDKKGNLLATIGEGILSEPTGVYVTSGYVYVADYGNLMVYKFDHEGNVIHEYGKPDSPLYGKSETYRPLKVSANISEDVYIISEGSTNGIVQINETGEFLGYFGVNSTSVSFRIILQKMIMTNAQKSKMSKIKPPSPINIAIDDDGIVYTGTNASDSTRLKKLNIAGSNVLEGSLVPEDIVDLTVDKDGNIYLVAEYGAIWLYDSFGNLLGVTEVKDSSQERLGAFKQPSGICVDEQQNIYITDKSDSSIHVLHATEMALQIFSGVRLYKEGLYVESMEIWTEVLTLNSNISLAHKAMGKAYFKQNDYANALKEFKLSVNTKGYSEAFWEIRNNWLMDNLTYVFILLIVIFAIKKILNYVDKKKKIYNPLRNAKKRFHATRVYQEMRTPLYILRHPIDLCDYVKRLKKVSWIGAFVIFLWFIISKVVAKYFEGFVFSGITKDQINVTVEILLLLVPFAAFVLSNYLVSTITDGEGSFKNVFTISTLSFAPYFLFNVPLAIITNVLTLNESFLYTFGTMILWAWSFILIFIVIKELHDYTFFKAIKNMLLTIFGMVIILLVVFITYVLIDQVIQFAINFR